MDRIGELKAALDQSRAGLLATLDRVAEGERDVKVHSEEDGWTVRDIVSHLFDSERGQMMQIERIRNGEPTVPDDFDVDRWNRGRQRRMAEMEWDEIVAGLHETREALRAALDGIDDEELALTGRHPALQQEIPLQRYLEIIAWHETTHTGEIRAGLGLD
jgi:hypothetical protein